MQSRQLVLITLVIALGCPRINAIDQSTPRSTPGYVRFTTVDEFSYTVEARDGFGRSRAMGQFDATHPLCFDWPYPDPIGQIWVRRRSPITEYYVRFHPQSQPYWDYSPGDQIHPRSNRHCRP